MVEHLSSTAGIVLKLLKVLGVCICILIVVMICGMITEESSRNISMLEILGYRDREVRSFVLSSGHLLVPVEPAGEGGNDSCGICVRACGIYSGAGPVRKENTPRGYGGELKECGRVGEYEGEPVGVLSVMYRHVESPTQPKKRSPQKTLDLE